MAQASVGVVKTDMSLGVQDHAKMMGVKAGFLVGTVWGGLVIDRFQLSGECRVMGT